MLKIAIKANKEKAINFALKHYLPNKIFPIPRNPKFFTRYIKRDQKMTGPASFLSEKKKHCSELFHIFQV